MTPLQFLKLRLNSIINLEFKDPEEGVSIKEMQFLPVVLPSGALAQIGKSVEFKPNDSDFAKFNSDWIVQSGNVQSIRTYGKSVLDMMDNLPEDIKFNVEPAKES